MSDNDWHNVDFSNFDKDECVNYVKFHLSHSYNGIKKASPDPSDPSFKDFMYGYDYAHQYALFWIEKYFDEVKFNKDLKEKWDAE